MIQLTTTFSLFCQYTNPRTHSFLAAYFSGVVERELRGEAQAEVKHAFAEVIYHLCAAGAAGQSRAKRLLLSLGYCQRRIQFHSVFALVEDCEMYLAEVPSDPAVTVLRAALQLASGVLVKYPKQLSTQVSRNRFLILFFFLIITSAPR